MKSKCRKIIRVTALLLVMILLAGCAASKEETLSALPQEESRAVSLDFLGGKDVMPVTGYFGPYINSYFVDGDHLADCVTDEFFQKIADMGINLITYTPTDYAVAPGVVKQILDLGEKYGIGIFITDTNVTGMVGGGEVLKKAVAKEMLNYYDHPAFCGMYVIDEPNGKDYIRSESQGMISDYKNLVDVLQNDFDTLVYVNLLGAGEFQRDREDYTKYVEEFCETLRPKVLMWDYYVYGDGDMDGYFWSLNLMRKQAEKYEIPFWSYIQAGGQWYEDDNFADGKYYPNEAQFNWNVNTALAFGVQGIQYFTAIQPSSFPWVNSDEGDFERNGMLGAAGNVNQWYHYAKNINAHIAAIDEVLMNSVNKGLIISGETKKEELDNVEYIIESGQFQELRKVTGDAMVSCLNYHGKTALYVVNYSQEYAQHITLSFTGTQNIRCIQNADTSYVQAKNLTLDMAAGEGVLLVLE